MRFLKFFTIAFTALFILLTITYSARVSIINSVAKTQLSLFQVKITCLDISLDSGMTIMVDKLCLQSPKADIAIVDMAIQWQYSPKIKVTDIAIRLADIKGTEHLFLNTNHPYKINNPQSRNRQSLSQLLSTTLRPYAEKIKQFQLPLNINIVEISYLPFTDSHKSDISKKAAQQQRETLYTGDLSAVDNTLSFSLRNAKKIDFIKAKLTKDKADFSIVLSTKLNFT
mgnify:CR=1 FL=1